MDARKNEDLGVMATKTASKFCYDKAVQVFTPITGTCISITYRRNLPNHKMVQGDTCSNTYTFVKSGSAWTLDKLLFPWYSVKTVTSFRQKEPLPVYEFHMQSCRCTANPQLQLIIPTLL